MRLALFMVLTVMVLLVVGCSLGAKTTTTTQAASGTKWVDLRGKAAQDAPAGAMLFRQPDGQLVGYVPSGAISGITWQAYQNSSDGYSVEYPEGWITQQSDNEGHQGLVVYPPGTDVSASIPGGAPGIGVGWVSSYTIPSADDPSVGALKDIQASGVQGTLITQGALGSSMIAVFPRAGGYLFVSGDASTDTLIEVFLHMVSSLKFSG